MGRLVRDQPFVAPSCRSVRRTVLAEHSKSAAILRRLAPPSRIRLIASIAVDVVQGDAGPLKLELLRQGIHARDPFLEPPTGADVAVNLCHARSLPLCNTFRNGEVFRK